MSGKALEAAGEAGGGDYGIELQPEASGTEQHQRESPYVEQT